MPDSQQVRAARRALDAAVYEALAAGLSAQIIQDEVWAALVDATGEEIASA